MNRAGSFFQRVLDLCGEYDDVVSKKAKDKLFVSVVVALIVEPKIQEEVVDE